MAKFALKADHFITPIKLILPGIIVSLVGASTAFFLFNNPEKNKAKQTYASWNVVREYENAYNKSAEDAICLSEQFDQVQFQKDLTNLLAVLIDNLKDLKGEENIDMRLKAFLNLKIARYTDSKRITEAFLDSVIKLNRLAELYPADQQIKQDAQDLQKNFSTELEHIQTRDTNELKRITLELNKVHTKYTDSFQLDLPKAQTAFEIKQSFAGKWRFPEVDLVVEFRKDKTGNWDGLGMKQNFQWIMTDKTVTMYIGNEVYNFILVESTASKLTAVWKEKKFVLIGCRKG